MPSERSNSYRPSVALPQTLKIPGKKTYNAFRRIIQSSDDESEVEVVAVTTGKATESTDVAQTTLKGKAAARERSSSPDIDASSDLTDGVIILYVPLRLFYNIFDYVIAMNRKVPRNHFVLRKTMQS